MFSPLANGAEVPSWILFAPLAAALASTVLTPVNTVLAKAAASGANNIQLGTSAPFASGENITVGADLYTINTVVTDSKGFVTGNVTLTSNLRKAYAAGT